MSDKLSRTAEIRALARQDAKLAEAELTQLLHDLFDMRARSVKINYDQYSLNSLNGFFEADGQEFFFKFHQEDGEEAMSGEYYRAEILSDAGLPVDLPVRMSSLPGEQILIYRRRSDPRMSDVLRALDVADDVSRRRIAVGAESDLSGKLLEVYQRTLHPVSVSEVAAEPIHRLFYQRMVDPVTNEGPAGRLADFYVGKRFEFPGFALDWDEFKTKRFVINGQRYLHSVGELFDAAMRRYRPDALADAGGLVAHGDAHNANVWFTEHDGKAELSFFDPAFAGSHIPALVAEVKATFHNIFAHPLWLYEPALASETFLVEGRVDGDEIHVVTDWAPSPIRQDLLRVKADELWKPLLATLASRKTLPDDWETVIRLGLFLSPTLVMNLRAGVGSHTPKSSLLGFAVAVMVGSPAELGANLMTDFFRQIDPHR